MPDSLGRSGHGSGATNVHVDELLESRSHRLLEPRFWSQDATGVLEDAERGDLFGFAVSATDFGNGPHADLAIGAPQESTRLATPAR